MYVKGDEAGGDRLTFQIESLDDGEHPAPRKRKKWDRNQDGLVHVLEHKPISPFPFSFQWVGGERNPQGSTNIRWKIIIYLQKEREYKKNERRYQVS